MSAQANYFKIGMFVIAAVLIGVVSIIVLGAGSLFQKTVMIETYFEESVQGLDNGSPLKFRGVYIGKIAEITLVGKAYTTDHRYVLIRADLLPEMLRVKTTPLTRADMKTEVEKGLRLRLSFQGLTGSAYLEMDYLDTKLNPPLNIDWQPKYCYIPSTPSTITRLSVAVDRIMKNIESIDFKATSENFNTSFKTLSQALDKLNLSGVGQEAKELLSELRATNQQIALLLKDPKIESLLSDASASMAAARRFSEDAQQPLSQLLVTFNDVSTGMAKMAVKLDALSGDTTESVARLKGILRRLDNLIAERQPDIETALENIRLISENLKEITDNAKKYPSQFLFGEPPPRSNTGEKQ
jgi:phospholipid/cholesterol/gamma-HCH transport system substrate-binding protein